MQEIKNKSRLILLIVLSITTVVAYRMSKPENKLTVNQHIFQLEDFKTIDQIQLQSDTGKIVLGYNGTRWRVNDRYDADRNMINVLFATLQQARPKRPVGNQEKDSLYHHLQESGVRVLLFEGANLQKEFLAGGNAPKTLAYFGEPSSKEVYVMNIPGYRVYVSGIFEMSENGWRDKTVFGFNWRNFKKLEATFPKTPAENFRVSLRKGYVGIEGMETDTTKLNAFFDNLFSLHVDEFVTGPGLRDSLEKVLPLANFTVTDVGDRTYRLTLYPSARQTSVPGIIQDSQVAIFIRRKIQPLLRPKSFFKKK